MNAVLTPILAALVRGDEVGADGIAAALGEILEGRVTDVQAAGFIVALRAKGETEAELVAFVQTMQRYAAHVDVADGAIDTCGTGGDRAGTVNVSTMAALIAAGAGVKVVKHGEPRRPPRSAARPTCSKRSASRSSSGPEGVARCVDVAGVGFCFAPRYHPAMRFVGPARRELAVPTTFNFVGPLANPARVRRQAVGVSDESMATKMLGTLRALGTERAMVFHGDDGLDELTTTTTSTVHELVDGELRRVTVDPLDFGLTRATAGRSAGRRCRDECAGGARGPRRRKGAAPRHRAAERRRRARRRRTQRRISRPGSTRPRRRSTAVRPPARSRSWFASARRPPPKKRTRPPDGSRPAVPGLRHQAPHRCRVELGCLPLQRLRAHAEGPGGVPARGRARGRPPIPRAPRRWPRWRPARPASANGGRTLSRRKVRAQAGVVPFWMRLLIWIVAVPVGFIVVFGVARAIGFLSQSQLEDVFLETGWNRFWPVARLLPFTALLTAGVVQFAVLYISRWRMRHALGPLQPHTVTSSGRSPTATGATGSSDAHTPSA